MVGVGRTGLTGLILLGCIFYFSGAGGWIWNRVTQLDEQCFAALNQHAPSIASPVCKTTASMIDGLGHAFEFIGSQFDGFQNRMLGGTGAERFTKYLKSLSFDGLTSPSEQLGVIMAQGPEALAQSLGQGSIGAYFQHSVDSYSIGHGIMSDPARTIQALPWLRYGANQPMGYGVISQLALGNLYLQGAPGVEANPQFAEYYLKQAEGSVITLQGANTPQSKALLKAMGGDPAAVKSQIEQILRQLKSAKKK
jgi:hypothetical protein